MSLRTRLIIAFLLLSVVPLTAVTMFWYASSVRAFERAAQREASESAADMGRRMELITADVGRRMDRLFEMQAAGDGEPDAESIRKRVAPLLGDLQLDEIDVRCIDEFRDLKIKESEARARAIARGRPYRNDRGRVLKPLSPAFRD